MDVGVARVLASVVVVLCLDLHRVAHRRHCGLVTEIKVLKVYSLLLSSFFFFRTQSACFRLSIFTTPFSAQIFYVSSRSLFFVAWRCVHPPPLVGGGILVRLNRVGAYQ